MTKIETIENNETYKKVLSDSCGGIMYDLSNQGTYNQSDVDLLIETWESMAPNEKSLAGGIVRGAIEFLGGQ